MAANSETAKLLQKNIPTSFSFPPKYKLMLKLMAEKSDENNMSLVLRQAIKEKAQRELTPNELMAINQQLTKK